MLLAVAVAATLAGASRAVAEPLYLSSMAVGGWPIARAALAGLRRRSLDMNVLMTLAAVGAVGIGSYAEGAWVLVLFAVGTTLESFAFDRSRRSIAELMDLAPEQARVLDDDGSEHLVPVEEVTVGTRFVVRPGERIPLDGIVVDGASSVDEAPITGESVPVDKQPDSSVFAGTLNAQGALTVRASSSAGESTLARVVALVEEAQGSRAPSERFVDRFARVYTPLVFAAALAVVVVPVRSGGSVDTWLYRALALLIVACPCSLVISIPVAVVSAVGRAAREGVLIKGGQALEDLARVNTRRDRQDRHADRGYAAARRHRGPRRRLTPTRALALVAAVERRSEHPLARGARRAPPARARYAFESPRRSRRCLGAACSPASPDASCGPAARGWSQSASAPRPKRWASSRLAARPPSCSAKASGALAVFGLADEAAPRSRCGDRGSCAGPASERVVMLTGDNERVAAAVAEVVGVDEFRAGLLPEDKLRAVEALNAERGPVAMVGDGINDAPALAAAPVGIAMGAAGTDVALQSADVALMSDDLARLPDALTGARQATRVMRQNVIASLAVKAIFVVLAPLGLVTLVLAVAADMGMSLLVTLNGLRLLRRRSTEHAGHASATQTAACSDGCCSG